MEIFISTSISHINVQKKINNIEIELIKVVDNYINVLADDLIKYFKGIPPSGDETTLDDVLNNQWLLIHELVELSELKRMNLDISMELFVTHPQKVDYAHIITEYELQFAYTSGDLKWIKSRLKDVNYWMKDDTLTSILKIRYQKILREYNT